MVFENFGLVMTFKCIMLEIVTSFDFQNIIFYTCLIRKFWYQNPHLILVEICSKYYQYNVKQWNIFIWEQNYSWYCHNLLLLHNLIATEFILDSRSGNRSTITNKELNLDSMTTFVNSYNYMLRAIRRSLLFNGTI